MSQLWGPFAVPFNDNYQECGFSFSFDNAAVLRHTVTQSHTEGFWGGRRGASLESPDTCTEDITCCLLKLGNTHFKSETFRRVKNI